MNTSLFFVGRGSGLKSGRVVTIDQDKDDGFKDLVLAVPSAPGDSGASVFTSDQRLAGML